MKILVTGGAGFIGFHTAKKLLERGDEIVVVDNLNTYYDVRLKHKRLEQLSKNPQFTFVQQDIGDIDGLRKVYGKHSFDKICHLAAQAGVRYSIEQPLTYVNSNILGTTIVFELAKEFKIPQVVYASSSSVYGKTRSPIFAESSPTNQPISLYAASKKATELIAHSYHHLFGIQSTGLRFFTVYGPWGRPDMFAYLLAVAITERTPIKVFNQGEMYRDFTYVDDIVNGVVASLDQPLGYQVFNLGGAQTTKLNDFIAIIEELMGSQVKKEYLPVQPGDVKKTAANVTLAEKLLDWTPKVPLRSGLEQFCAWFKEYYPRRNEV